MLLFRPHIRIVLGLVFALNLLFVCILYFSKKPATYGPYLIIASNVGLGMYAILKKQVVLLAFDTDQAQVKIETVRFLKREEITVLGKELAYLHSHRKGIRGIGYSELQLYQHRQLLLVMDLRYSGWTRTDLENIAQALSLIGATQLTDTGHSET